MTKGYEDLEKEWRDRMAGKEAETSDAVKKLFLRVERLEEQVKGLQVESPRLLWLKSQIDSLKGLFDTYATLGGDVRGLEKKVSRLEELHEALQEQIDSEGSVAPAPVSQEAAEPIGFWVGLCNLFGLNSKTMWLVIKTYGTAIIAIFVAISLWYEAIPFWGQTISEYRTATEQKLARPAGAVEKLPPEAAVIGQRILNADIDKVFEEEYPLKPIDMVFNERQAQWAMREGNRRRALRWGIIPERWLSKEEPFPRMVDGRQAFTVKVNGTTAEIKPVGDDQFMITYNGNKRKISARGALRFIALSD